MPKNNTSSATRNKKWIKEGRGGGSGKNYIPWLTVRDVSSEGRSHRIFGHKSQRTHHLLSDLELAVFFLLEWHQETTDIREQFPLRLEDTQVLAAKRLRKLSKTIPERSSKSFQLQRGVIGFPPPFFVA
ncbi:hypothetical protein EDE11_1532 [Methylomonas methanica]|uniref:Uncharacterized protein n=1 Tax=Methylomonas methanica TaxID=421 RepID=A0ABY2CFW0_METMH|nr:hypothetical protein EDE11_1532 [Methylomonas methanica]